MTPARPDLRPTLLSLPEAAFLALIGVVTLADLSIAARHGVTIDWHSFALGGGVCLGLVIVGIVMRRLRRPERATKLVVIFGLNGLFAMMMGIFFHVQMPRPEPVLTQLLLDIDHWFGFDWPAFVDWAAAHPPVGPVLRAVYLTSFFQLMTVMILLALLGRTGRLDRMIWTNALALLGVYAVWQLLPNLSQSTYLPIPPETAEAVRLVTDSAYGAVLRQMATEGLPTLASDGIVGAVAFPSYHMVMACVAVWFTRGTPLFWPALALNIAMVPAMLLHGAHHVADLLGGVLVFAAALPPAGAIVARLSRIEAARAG